MSLFRLKVHKPQCAATATINVIQITGLLVFCLMVLQVLVFLPRTRNDLSSYYNHGAISDAPSLPIEYSADGESSLLSSATGERAQFVLPITATDDIAPINLHANYGFDCGNKINLEDTVAPSTIPLFEMVSGYSPSRSTNGVGHRMYRGPIENGVMTLTQLQICSYYALQKFQALAEAHNMSRYSAHGGTLMAAVCHRSINPWDDDIDITVSTCEPLARLYASAGSVAARYPAMPVAQYSVKGWEGRLLDDEWILLKGSLGRRGNWYKLKAVSQIENMPARDLAGMDIMCFESSISQPEAGPMESSGFRAACKSESVYVPSIQNVAQHLFVQ
jgi:hypothetical protein